MVNRIGSPRAHYRIGRGQLPVFVIVSAAHGSYSLAVLTFCTGGSSMTQATETRAVLRQISKRLRAKGLELALNESSTFGDKVVGAALIHAAEEIGAALKEEVSG